MNLQSIIDHIPQRKEFNYWFVPRKRDIKWEVFDSTIHTMCAYILKVNNGYELSSNTIDDDTKTAIMNDFNMFQLRPEYLMFDREQIVGVDIAEVYNLYLLGACLGSSTYKDDDTAILRFCKAVDWLKTTDFYEAPASTIYHESIRCGLVLHTVCVASRIAPLTESHLFSNVNIYDAILVALVHDWCKIGKYELYTKNVKDEATGQWVPTPSYRHKSSLLPMGHGDSSAYLASKFFSLTDEMYLAIKWHMGRWYVCDSDINDLQQANENYPLVHLIQFADQMSITKYSGLSK